MQTKSRSVLGLVFLTVFIDLIGFSVIFPLFPEMLRHYVELEGADSLVGRLQAALQEVVGSRENADFAVVVLFGGVLGSVYSILQFLSAPFWGALSDRIGRRPILLVTLGGTALSYVLWFLSGRFVVLVAARLLGGVMAGNISIASAVVADTQEGPQRAKGMGIIGMAIGLGFVLGPALGGIASYWSLAEGAADGSYFAVNPFSAAAAAAFVLALFNWVWALTHFPETHPRGAVTRGVERTLRPFKALATLRYPGVQRTNLVYFLYLMAFSAMEFTLTFLAFERLGYTPRENAWMFVFVGLVIAVVQGGVVRRMAPRMGEKRVTLIGLSLLIPGFLLVGFTQGSPQLYLGLFFLAVGSALAMPCLSALVSRYSPADAQGLVLGTFRSAGALSRAVGPVIGGALYWLLGSTAPYLGGALVVLVPLGLAAGLPPVPDSEPAGEGEAKGPEPKAADTVVS